MTEREKIIELAKECGIKNRCFPQGEVWGYEHNIEKFYHAAQADAFEQAAQVCEKKWRKEDSFDSHSNAKAIRQLRKEMK